MLNLQECACMLPSVAGQQPSATCRLSLLAATAAPPMLVSVCHWMGNLSQTDGLLVTEASTAEKGRRGPQMPLLSCARASLLHDPGCMRLRHVTRYNGCVLLRSAGRGFKRLELGPLGLQDAVGDPVVEQQDPAHGFCRPARRCVPKAHTLQRLRLHGKE